MAKTKHEMRQEAIERLKTHANIPLSYRNTTNAIIGDDYSELTGNESINRIIDLLTDDEWLTEDDYLELLKDAAGDCERIRAYYKGLLKECNRLCDDTYMQLPRDVNGEVIHLYDELAGYGYPNGGVVCKAIVNDQMILVGRITDTYREWLLWDAYECHHYKKPTVEDVLREFCDEVQRCCDTEDTIAEYAKKLQLKEDEE
jgi:hypothetical protein